MTRVGSSDTADHPERMDCLSVPVVGAGGRWNVGDAPTASTRFCRDGVLGRLYPLRRGWARIAVEYRRRLHAFAPR